MAESVAVAKVSLMHGAPEQTKAPPYEILRMYVADGPFRVLWPPTMDGLRREKHGRAWPLREERSLAIEFLIHRILEARKWIDEQGVLSR